MKKKKERLNGIRKKIFNNVCNKKILIKMYNFLLLNRKKNV